MVQKPHSAKARAASCLILAAFGVTTNAVRAERLSTLTDGNFERQLEIPTSRNVPNGSPLMQKALEGYAKLPFDIGERTRYEVTYLGVKVGSMEMILRTPIQWEDRWAHRITGEVRNADWYAWMVTLHDAVEGVNDSDAGFTPLRFWINQQEPGGFKQSKVIEFDSRQNQVHQITKRKERDPKKEDFEFKPGTKDALGGLFYLRLMVPWDAPQKDFEVPMFTSEKTWTGKGKFLRTENKEVEGNSFECDVYDIKSQFGGLMEQKGEVRVWLTRDPRRLPVYIEAKLLFGYVKVSLIEWDQGFADATRKKVYPPIRRK